MEAVHIPQFDGIWKRIRMWSCPGSPSACRVSSEILLSPWWLSFSPKLLLQPSRLKQKDPSWVWVSKTRLILETRQYMFPAKFQNIKGRRKAYQRVFCGTNTMETYRKWLADRNSSLEFQRNTLFRRAKLSRHVSSCPRIPFKVSTQPWSQVIRRNIRKRMNDLRL